MKCPRCGAGMLESYDGRTGENHQFECEECGFTQNAFDTYAESEGYPADPDEFENWRRQKGL